MSQTLNAIDFESKHFIGTWSSAAFKVSKVISSFQFTQCSLNLNRQTEKAQVFLFLWKKSISNTE